MNLHKQIFIGDVLEQLDKIPENSIDVVLTSPPYFDLRDYGVQGQWGLEGDFRDYLSKMRLFMEKIKRVLKPTGTCWINLGDSYSGSGKGIGSKDSFKEYHRMQERKKSTYRIQPRSRLGIPERFYIDCIDAGWCAENYIPWVKGNPMPSSVTGRFSNTWEPIFYLSKSSEPSMWYNSTTLQFNRKPPIGIEGIESQDWTWRPCRKCNETGKINEEKCKSCDGLGKKKRTLWKSESRYFNLNAVRVTPKTASSKPPKRKEPQNNSKLFDLDTEPEWKTKDSIQDKQNNTVRLHRGRKGNPHKQDATLGADGKPKATYSGFNDRWKSKQEKYKTLIKEGHPDSNANLMSNFYSARKQGKDHDAALNHPAGKNPGDVFFINSKPFIGAHFATFPIELPLTILRAACPEQVCSKCGLPRFPIVKPTEEYSKLLGKGFHDHSGDKTEGMLQEHYIPSTTAAYYISGWTKCDCNAPFQPGIVLDPFFGAGTTAVAAEMLGRNWCGIELKEEYVDDIIKKRLGKHNNRRMEEFVRN